MAPLLSKPETSRMKLRLLAATALGLASGMHAQASANPFGAAPVSDRQLSGIRGGFKLPNGMNVAVAVEIETRVDGALALRTVLNLVDNAKSALEVFAPPGPKAELPAQAAAVASANPLASPPPQATSAPLVEAAAPVSPTSVVDMVADSSAPPAIAPPPPSPEPVTAPPVTVAQVNMPPPPAAPAVEATPPVSLPAMDVGPTIAAPSVPAATNIPAPATEAAPTTAMASPSATPPAVSLSASAPAPPVASPAISEPAVSLNTAPRASVASSPVPVESSLGAVTIESTKTGSVVILKGPDLEIQHLTGNATGILIANTLDNRVIDTIATINVSLSDSAVPVGNMMLRMDAIILDAVGGFMY